MCPHTAQSQLFYTNSIEVCAAGRVSEDFLSASFYSLNYAISAHSLSMPSGKLYLLLLYAVQAATAGQLTFAEHRAHAADNGN